MANYLDEAHPDLTEESLKQLLDTSPAPLTDKVPLESLSTVFKAPDNPQSVYSSFGEEFERYKVKVDLLKWLIGTVGLTLITLIINWGFRDRQQGMNEISQYDKYATELIVLNDNPVKKRMLAQFFARVTPSETLKDGWEQYYTEVNQEFNQFMKEAITEKNRLAELKKIDTTKLSNAQKSEIKILEPKVKEKETIIKAPTLVPEMSANLEQAKDFETQGFSSLLNMDIDNAIKSFTQSESSFNGYNSVYDIAVYLKKNRDNLLGKSPTKWKSTYSTILTKYSWKMPSQFNAKLTELSK